VFFFSAAAILIKRTCIMPNYGTQSDKKSTVTIILAFAAVYIIWGTTYLGIRVAVETMPPFLMSAVRFIISGVVLFLILRLRGAPLPRRVHWRSAVIAGAFLLVGGNGLITWAVQEVPSSTAALVVATVPLWMALLDWLVFKRARPGRRVTTGLILGLAGIILLIGPGQILGTSRFSLPALLILLLAPIFWSVGSLYSREANLPENVFMATAMEMLAGGALLLLGGLLLGEWGQLDVASFSTRSLAAFAYLVVFGAIIAFTAFVWLMKVVPATKVATYTYVNPVIAVLLGGLILDEVITGTTITAVVIIVLAVILITTGRPKNEPTNQQTIQPIIQPSNDPV
jgi:drug/metabolite transporter (DMT)-like permease